MKYSKFIGLKILNINQSKINVRYDSSLNKNYYIHEKRTFHIFNVTFFFSQVYILYKLFPVPFLMSFYDILEKVLYMEANEKDEITDSEEEDDDESDEN